MKYWLLCAGVAALVPVLDQLTKYFVRTFLQVGESVSVWGNFFRIHYILNDGMAFGSFDGARWVFMIFTPIALAAIVYYLVRYRKNLSALSAVSLSMVFGGGFSNMIDRIFFIHLDPTSKGLFDGRVVDFLDFNISVGGHRLWNAVFNVADAFVVVGVLLFLLDFILKEARSSKKKKEEAKILQEGPEKFSAAESAEAGNPTEAEGPAEAESPEKAENPTEAESAEESRSFDESVPETKNVEERHDRT